MPFKFIKKSSAMQGIYDEICFLHNANMTWELGEYEMSNSFCLKKVVKKLRMFISLISSLNNVLAKAEAFQLSIGILKLNRASP